MPIIKSAIKRNRQAKVRTTRNVATRASVKKQIKAAKAQIEAGKPKSNAELLAAIAAIDRAAKGGALHQRTAARRKSRLTRAYNQVAAKPFGTEAPAKPAAKKTVAKKAAPKKPAAKKAPAKKTTAKK